MPVQSLALPANALPPSALPHCADPIVPAYNLTRVMNIVGIKPLMAVVGV